MKAYINNKFSSRNISMKWRVNEWPCLKHNLSGLPGHRRCLIRCHCVSQHAVKLCISGFVIRLSQGWSVFQAFPFLHEWAGGREKRQREGDSERGGGKDREQGRERGDERRKIVCKRMIEGAFAFTTLVKLLSKRRSTNVTKGKKVKYKVT